MPVSPKIKYDIIKDNNSCIYCCTVFGPHLFKEQTGRCTWTDYRLFFKKTVRAIRQRFRWHEQKSCKPKLCWVKPMERRTEQSGGKTEAWLRQTKTHHESLLTGVNDKLMMICFLLVSGNRDSNRKHKTNPETNDEELGSEAIDQNWTQFQNHLKNPNTLYLCLSCGPICHCDCDSRTNNLTNTTYI